MRKNPINFVEIRIFAVENDHFADYSAKNRNF